MAIFHPLRVQDIRQETEACVSVAFEVPEDLRGDFVFTPGQYLTLRTQIDGEEVRRSYSICSSPKDGELRVAIKKVPGGKFSTFANDSLEVGDMVESMEPKGTFTIRAEPDSRRTYVAFAAGSGITPIMSIMRSVLQEEQDSSFLLFYGNRHSDAIIFREQIEDLKNTYLGRLAVHHVLSGEHYHTDMFAGRISADKCRAFAQHLFDPQAVAAFLLCGPKPMIDDVQESLIELGVDQKRIKHELFTTAFPKVAGESPVKKTPHKRSGVAAEVEIIMDGGRFRFQMEKGKDTVLDAAANHGAELPYSCKGGVCSTCRAKVLSGEVDMDLNYALEPEEVEQGYVLTCQSHPRTSHLVLDFDS